MIAGRLFFFIFTIAVVALIRLNDVVSCHEIDLNEWLLSCQALPLGTLVEFEKWWMPKSNGSWLERLFIGVQIAVAFQFNKLWTAIIYHLRMPRMANFLVLCSNKIVLKTGSSFLWWKDFNGVYHRWHHRNSKVVLKGSCLSKIYGGGPDFIVEVIKKRKKIEIAYVIPLFI